MASTAVEDAGIDSLKYLNNLDDVAAGDAYKVLSNLASKIQLEVNKPDMCNVNQTALNVAVRAYYHIVDKFELRDEHFANLQERLTYREPNAFLLLQALLLTSHWRQLDSAALEICCTTAIIETLQHKSNSILPVLKATSLLVKKFPNVKLLPLTLKHFYHCLQKQSQTGSREEALTIFNHCCKQRERAFFYFRVIVEFWPWTNRNKYYLLSGILNNHHLEELLARTTQSESEFFAGLRLSLSYKGLRAPSQYPVKSLSSQGSVGLISLAVDLLIRGSIAEIQNFYSQWFARIEQRNVLFQQLQLQPEILEFFQSSDEACRSGSEQYRLILIFSMFAKEIFALSRVHFFKISTELLTNCSSFETDAQLLIFKFMVENLSSFAVEDCLEFFYTFIELHYGVENTEFRHTLLGKMPIIINHTAKHFNKALKGVGDAGSDALAHNIQRFFQQLQQLVDLHMESSIYQPKIFALKMLEILIKSLYAENVSKNAKLCSTQQNQQLGRFLLERKVFQPEATANQLYRLLQDPHGYDDTLELIAKLQLLLGRVESEKCRTDCLRLCATSDVDECALAPLYAQLVISTLPNEQLEKFYNECIVSLSEKWPQYLADPLQAAKSGNGNLFGYLGVLCEIFRNPQFEAPTDAVLLSLVETMQNSILKFLNAVNEEANEATSAASFRDMEEGLELLVLKSSYSTDASGNKDECRKYLLMSLWLTLKGCCELAATLGCALVRIERDDNGAMLKRCLNINIAVLTRCRHKGAIEVAGLSIGQLTRALTRTPHIFEQGIQLLEGCIEQELLTDSENRRVSTTRRGAGFSIMFLHVIKNDEPNQRLLLKRAMTLILHRLQQANDNAADLSSSSIDSNHDRWEALFLHYLCVLVRDTELRVDMSRYYNEVMLVAMDFIDHTEWTISNAALQLFGALVPKLVGQRQATEFEEKLYWEPSELSYDELVCLLPRACEQMFNYCDKRKAQKEASLVLFLGFLSKVEDLRMSAFPGENQLLLRFRQLSWQLLRHKCEQVRRLAATCFVRAHEVRCDLPAALMLCAKASIQVSDDNTYGGLMYVLHAGVLKLQHEARHIWPAERLKNLYSELGSALYAPENLTHFHGYTLSMRVETNCQLMHAQAELLRLSTK